MSATSRQVVQQDQRRLPLSSIVAVSRMRSVPPTSTVISWKGRRQVNEFGEACLRLPRAIMSAPSSRYDSAPSNRQAATLSGESSYSGGDLHPLPSGSSPRM